MKHAYTCVLIYNRIILLHVLKCKAHTEDMEVRPEEALALVFVLLFLCLSEQKLFTERQSLPLQLP